LPFFGYSLLAVVVVASLLLELVLVDRDLAL
jgi:hypothetical protein